MDLENPVNRLKNITKDSGLSRKDLAEVVGIDELELAMAERGIGHTHLDVIFDLASVLDCQPQDIYPGLIVPLAGIDMSSADTSAAERHFLSAEIRRILLRDGIDPDMRRWFMSVKLFSGSKTNYLISSPAKELIEQCLHNCGEDEFIVFISDCRTIAIRLAALAEISFSNDASYAGFSSERMSESITIVTREVPHPRVHQARPGEVCAKSVVEFIQSANEGKAKQFLMVEQYDEQKFLGVKGLEVIEVPFSVLIEDILLDSNRGERSKFNDLKEMTVCGSA